MKKLKFNKLFRPLQAAYDDEFYRNGIFEFNITKLLAFIAANPSQFLVEHIEVDKYDRFDKESLDREKIATANLAIPIILGEISPARFNVIDGNHRLEKARRQGLKTFPAYKVLAEQHIAFLTSEGAYCSYIDYWNGKVDQLSGGAAQ